LRTITYPGTPKLAHEHGIDMDSKRYHLYVSHACPYSARAVLARCISQLTDEVTMSAVDPVRGPDGWVFGSGEYADPLNGFRTLREVYEATDASHDGRVSVPVLWDRKTQRIASTESSEIMRMFGSATLYPEPLRGQIDSLNEWIGKRINDGVYDVGKATAQVTYEREQRKLLEALDELEQRLARSRFLLGDEPVESDWRLFPTLVRFDAVYARLFKCTREIAEMPRLWSYTRELYRRPGIAATVRHDEILRHYYRSFPALNPNGIVPLLDSPDFAGN
jgi:glutathionyl-hydroquinone reductase